VCVYTHTHILIIMFVKTTSVLEISSLFTCCCTAISLVTAVHHLAQLLCTHSLTNSLPAPFIDTSPVGKAQARMFVGNLCLPRHPISFLNILHGMRCNPTTNSCNDKTVTWCSMTGFGLVIGFNELLQLVTTSKDYAVTVLHTSQITIEHTRSSQSVAVFTSRCSIAASSGICSVTSGFPNCPQPQLPASHSKSSQQLNHSSPLTHPFPQPTRSGG
jgi:hypothetical protein